MSSSVAPWRAVTGSVPFPFWLVSLSEMAGSGVLWIAEHQPETPAGRLIDALQTAPGRRGDQHCEKERVHARETTTAR